MALTFDDGPSEGTTAILEILREAGAREQETRFFLYLPEPLFARFGWCERALGRVPLGGQYAVFGR